MTIIPSTTEYQSGLRSSSSLQYTEQIDPQFTQESVDSGPPHRIIRYFPPCSTVRSPRIQSNHSETPLINQPRMMEPQSSGQDRYISAPEDPWSSQNPRYLSEFMLKSPRAPNQAVDTSQYKAPLLSPEVDFPRGSEYSTPATYTPFTGNSMRNQEASPDYVRERHSDVSLQFYPEYPGDHPISDAIFSYEFQQTQANLSVLDS